MLGEMRRIAVGGWLCVLTLLAVTVSSFTAWSTELLRSRGTADFHGDMPRKSGYVVVELKCSSAQAVTL